MLPFETRVKIIEHIEDIKDIELLRLVCKEFKVLSESNVKELPDHWWSYWCENGYISSSLFDRFPGLVKLDLSNRLNVLSHVRWLAKLTALTTLKLNKLDKVKDLSPLSGLTALTTLNLDGLQKLTDLSPLSGLTALTVLRLGHRFKKNLKITNLSPLAGLTRLEALEFGERWGPPFPPPEILSPLAGLVSLKVLQLGHLICLGHQRYDLSPLTRLTSLKRLFLGKNSNVDISVLNGMDITLGSPLAGVHYFEKDKRGDDEDSYYYSTDDSENWYV